MGKNGRSGSRNGIRRSVYERGSSGQTRSGNGNHFRYAFYRRSYYTGRTPEHIHTDDGNRAGNSYPHGQTVIPQDRHLTTQKPVCRLSLSKNEILHFCKDAEGIGKRRGQHICSANASHKWLSASLAVWGVPNSIRSRHSLPTRKRRSFKAICRWNFAFILLSIRQRLE